MAWIELHQTLPSSKKTIRLKALLRVTTPHAVGLMCMLWLWAVDNARDGDISSVSAKELAEVCGWSSRRAAELLEAMTESGFLDREGDSLRIHDWEDYGGRLQLSREKERERKRRYRDKQAAGTGTSPSTLHHSTQPDTTLPDTTQESSFSGGGEDAGADASTEFLQNRGLLVESYLGVDEKLIGELDALATELIPRFWRRQPGELDRAKLFLNLYDLDDGKPRQNGDRRDLLLYALEQSVMNGHEGSWPYVEGVLQRLHRRGLKNLRQAEFYDLDREEMI